MLHKANGQLVLDKSGQTIITLLQAGRGEIIRTQANAGDELAKKVMDAYAFWYECPGDSVAEYIFRIVFRQYEEVFGVENICGRCGKIRPVLYPIESSVPLCQSCAALTERKYA